MLLHSFTSFVLYHLILCPWNPVTGIDCSVWEFGQIHFTNLETFYISIEGVPVAQWVEPWPTDIAVPVWALPEAEIFSVIKDVTLHTAFHYHLPIMLIWLKYCWKGCKITSHPSYSYNIYWLNSKQYRPRSTASVEQFDLGPHCLLKQTFSNIEWIYAFLHWLYHISQRYDKIDVCSLKMAEFKGQKLQMSRKFCEISLTFLMLQWSSWVQFNI